jgi:hypothetical protein
MSSAVWTGVRTRLCPDLVVETRKRRNCSQLRTAFSARGRTWLSFARSAKARDHDHLPIASLVAWPRHHRRIPMRPSTRNGHPIRRSRCDSVTCAVLGSAHCRPVPDGAHVIGVKLKRRTSRWSCIGCTGRCARRTPAPGVRCSKGASAARIWRSRKRLHPRR